MMVLRVKVENKFTENDQFYCRDRIDYFICRKCYNVISINRGKIVYDLKNVEMVFVALNEDHKKVPGGCPCGSKSFLRITQDLVDIFFKYRVKQVESDERKALDAPLEGG